MVSAIPQILVAGLGNLPMPTTRHSLGQYVVDAIALRLGIQMSSDKKGIVGRAIVTLGDTPVSLILFKSKSLMNVSGPSIAEIYRSSVKSPSAMIVLQDSISHRVGQLSVKLGGSANGHNGIKSIISALGGEQGFYRFRLGVGQRGDTDAVNFVMGKLTRQERDFWSEEGLDDILEEIGSIARKAAR